eukprot:Gb_36430 [translate_table: standard]
MDEPQPAGHGRKFPPKKCIIGKISVPTFQYAFPVSFVLPSRRSLRVVTECTITVYCVSVENRVLSNERFKTVELGEPPGLSDDGQIGVDICLNATWRRNNQDAVLKTVGSWSPPRAAGKMPDGAPSCFSGDNREQSGSSKTTQNLVTCTYQTKFAGHCRVITVTWCKNVMGQGLCVAVDDPACQSMCKVDLKPWYFWRKHGWKSFPVDGRRVDVFWDLGSAKFVCGPEPQQGYYIAIVCDEEVVLLLGDMNEQAYKKTKSRPSAIEATLLSRKEHVFGNKCFATKAQFCESGRSHEVCIECHTKGPSDPEMFISVDSELVVQVKRLLWKFRGNHTIHVEGVPVQIFWDVHDWLFTPAGMGHAIFIFKPTSSVSDPENSIRADTSIKSSPRLISSASSKLSSSSSKSNNFGISPSDFRILLYAWKFD